MSKTSGALAAAGLLFCVLAASPAPAQTANRAWVSGHGTDAAGCGSPTSPCRSLQYTHDSIVAAGGEIDILDPAGYGAINITKAINIVNDGVGTAGVQPSSGDAITINANPSDTVYLRGLDLEAVGNIVSITPNGIDFFSGARLIVDHCVIRHFHFGISVEPTAGVTDVGVYDSLLSGNFIGFDANLTTGSAKVTGALDHVIASHNIYGGVAADTNTVSTSVTLVVSNTNTSDNTQYGIAAEADAGTVVMEVNNSTMSGNGAYGFWNLAASKSHIAHSVLDANGTYGIYNNVASGAAYSASDNHVEENASGAIGGSPLSPEILQ